MICVTNLHLRAQLLQSCLTPCEPVNCSLPWDSPGKNTGVVAMPSFRGSSWSRNWTCVSCLAREGNSTPLQYFAWKIPWTEESGGLQSMGSHRVRHDWSDLAAAAAPALQVDLFNCWATREAANHHYMQLI